VAIIYEYPLVDVNTSDFFLVSKRNNSNKTANVRISDVINAIPDILDLDDFDLYGESFGNTNSTPDTGDTITYDGNVWKTGTAGTVEREIINVTAAYDASTNVYSGNGVPTPSAYSEQVIYKVLFDTTNTSIGSSLNISSLGNSVLVAPDQSGALQPISINFIQSGTIYYLSYLANTFQISTTPPTPSTNSVEYSNSLPISISQNVGGVKANNGENWAPIQDGLDDQGNPKYRGWTLTEIMNRIFYPYQNPAFTSFKMVSATNPAAAQAQNVEVGTTVAGGMRDFKWTFNNYVNNVAANTLSINDLTNPINTGVTNPIIQNTSISPNANVNIGDPIVKTDESTHVWRATAKTTKENPAGQQDINSPQFAISWHYKWYYGTSTLETLTPAQIPTLLTGVLGNQRTKTNASFDATGGGKYWYLAYPNYWGDLNNWFFGTAAVSTGPIGAPYNLEQPGTDVFRFYAEVTGVPVPNSPSVTYRVYRTARAQNGVSTVLIQI